MSRGASRLHLKASEAILQVEGLKKAFRFGESELVLFENLSFQVARGEMLAIVGESGAGKSTLLHILGALDRASAGDVYCAHLRLSSLSDDAAAEFRNRELGFVWQFHYLLPEFTALENVAMPLLLREVSRQQADRKSTRLNSSHSQISYAVFCLKKKNTKSAGTPYFTPTRRLVSSSRCIWTSLPK